MRVWPDVETMLGERSPRQLEAGASNANILHQLRAAALKKRPARATVDNASSDVVAVEPFDVPAASGPEPETVLAIELGADDSNAGPGAEGPVYEPVTQEGKLAVLDSTPPPGDSEAPALDDLHRQSGQQAVGAVSCNGGACTAANGSVSADSPAELNDFCQRWTFDGRFSFSIGLAELSRPVAKPQRGGGQAGTSETYFTEAGAPESSAVSREQPRKSRRLASSLASLAAGLAPVQSAATPAAAQPALADTVPNRNGKRNRPEDTPAAAAGASVRTRLEAEPRDSRPGAARKRSADGSDGTRAGRSSDARGPKLVERAARGVAKPSVSQSGGPVRQGGREAPDDAVSAQPSGKAAQRRADAQRTDRPAEAAAPDSGKPGIAASKKPRARTSEGATPASDRPLKARRRSSDPAQATVDATGGVTARPRPDSAKSADPPGASSHPAARNAATPRAHPAEARPAREAVPAVAPGGVPPPVQTGASSAPSPADSPLGDSASVLSVLQLNAKLAKLQARAASLRSEREAVAAARAKLESQPATAAAPVPEQPAELCLNFCRTGVCGQRDCPLLHARDKVVPCGDFIFKGRCNNSACMLQHRAARELMPLCTFYHQGKCNKGAACLYSHADVEPTAPVCQPFLQGHCPRGDRCPNKHLTAAMIQHFRRFPLRFRRPGAAFEAGPSGRVTPPAVPGASAGPMQGGAAEGRHIDDLIESIFDESSRGRDLASPALEMPAAQELFGACYPCGRAVVDAAGGIVPEQPQAEASASLGHKFGRAGAPAASACGAEVDGVSSSECAGVCDMRVDGLLSARLLTCDVGVGLRHIGGILFRHRKEAAGA